MTEATATLRWAHRGLGTELWLRVEAPDTGRLVLAAECDGDGGPGTGEPIVEVAPISCGTNDVVVDLPASIPHDEHPPLRWRVGFAAGGGTALDGIRPVCGTPGATAGLEPIVAPVCGGPATIHVDAADGEPVIVRLTDRPAWGEARALGQVDGRLHVSGEVIGDGGEITSAALVDRDSGERIRADVELEGARFVVHADLRRLASSDTDRHLNVVLASGAGDLRIAGHLDDVVNKGRAVVTRPVLVRDAGQWWTVDPRFTDRNNVVVTVRARQEGDGPADPRDRWELDPGDADDDDHDESRPTWLHRLARHVAAAVFHALAVRARRARRAPATAPTGGRRHVHLLLASLHAMGGTIRATVNTANALAADERNVVSLGVVYRLKERRFFDVDPRVRTRVMVDAPWIASHGGRGLRAWVRQQALRTPSAVIPREDPRYYRFSLLHDIALYRWLRSVDRGSIVTTRSGLSIAAARFARPGVRLVAQQHVPFTTQAPDLQRQLVDSYRAVDAVTVLTEADAAAVREALAGETTVVRQVPNSLYDLVPRPSPLTENRILCGGRFTPAKGIDLMVEAFARIAAERPSWQLRIYGSARPDRLEAVREMVRRHDLDDRVLLMAPTGRLELEMAKASICAVPSRFESFGMMIIEAMRCGLPVVAFDCPVGPREIITDDHDGVLVAPEDVEAFADRLLELTADPDRRARLARAAMGTAASYAPRTVAARFEALLDEIARTPLRARD